MASTRAVNLNTQHPFYPPNMPKLPDWVTRRKFMPEVTGDRRAPGDQGVIRQTILLTKSDPNAQFSVTPAASSNEHPFWTADEKYIYFDSNRNSDTDSTPRADGIYNIFRMYPDGSGIVQIEADTVNQLDPTVSTDGSTLAFVAGGSFTAGQGTNFPSTQGFNLYILNLSTLGQATPLTNVGQPFNFADVRHPTWSPGANAIAFSGRLVGQATYHIFQVDATTGVITQLTGGASNELSPAWSPDGNLIAFSTNAAGWNGSSGPIQASSVASNFDIWVVSNNPFQLRPERITNFLTPNDHVQSSNFNPSWSTRRVDPLGYVPQQTDPNGNSSNVSEQFLAFSSTRADLPGSNNGVPVYNAPTLSIYWLFVNEQQTSPGIFSIVNPESPGGNTAFTLRTSDPAAGLDPTEPTYNFNSNHQFNLDYPVWPQYLNSYRVAFQSDRGGTLELWGATIFDIDAPSLLKYDINNNEIVHVELEAGSPTGISVREVNPGQTVRFKVRVADYETGVESVFLQIKTPESSWQSPDNQEHKVFLSETGPALLSLTQFVNQAPFEFDCQAVDANQQVSNAFPRFKAAGVNGVGNPSWPGGNLYTPGIDDEVAFTGGIDTPDWPNWVSPMAPPGTTPVQPKDGQGGCWLRLYDDGPASAGGHEPPGEVANDGVWTADWTTPVNFPSDWIIDVIVRDRAIDPFNPSATSNWKIYDNVWGFTTLPFLAKNNALYVSDYDTGQKFLGGRFGTGFTNGTKPSTNFLGLPFNGTPTESYMTEFDSSLYPNSYWTPATLSPLSNFKTTLGINSYSDGLDDDGTGFPPTQRYDIWRIQCRGPIPQAVLNQYLPHFEQEPPDVISGGGPLKVLVADRCVLWHAPYLGDLFVGPGTLLDNNTQTMLSNFVAQGGRLFVCGQDVAWALTLGGSSPNSFLNNTLHVQYVSDSIFTANSSTLPPNRDQINMTATNPAGASRGGLPIGWETWYNGGFHDYPGAIPNDPPGSGSLYIGSTISTGREFACPNNEAGLGTPDVVSFIDDPNFKADIDDVDGRFNDPSINSPAIMWYTDTAANSRIVFSPFGWESINPETLGAGTGLMLLNRRMELMHNVLDYLRTGRIIGTIRAVNSSGGASTPLANAFVRATDIRTGNTVATALTQGDGTYSLDGLPPTGIYNLDATARGYITQHQTGNIFHGAFYSRNDFYMLQAQPGSISGTVTIFGTNAPVGGAIVTATDISIPGESNPPAYNSQPSDPTTGNYDINNLPASSYSLAVTNISALGFVSSVPANYSPVVVAQSQNVTGKNFQLKQQPGSITGTVFVADASGNPTSATIKGAVVTAANSTTSVASQPTAANGVYTISGLDPGSYGVTAIAPGYAQSASTSVSVGSNQTVSNINFALKQIPPGGVSGLVATSTGIPVGGATVTLTDTAGDTFTTTTGAVQTVTNPANGQQVQVNYTIANVPAGGTVSVSASKGGYTPKPNPDTQTISIAAGTVTYGVNFALDPLFVFDNNLAMVSSPYYYTVDGTPGAALMDVASLLSVPSSDVASNAFQFITWDGGSQHYIYHPTPPANSFDIGRGYFMQDTDSATILALTNPNGIPAPKDSSGNYLPFSIQLQTGWNMIGEPLPFSVNFNQLQIQDNGQLINVPQAQTESNPAIGAALWTYQQGAYEVVYTMDPFRGYWLRAFRPVTLIVTPAAETGRAITGAGRALEFASGAGQDWKLDLLATAGQIAKSRAQVGVFHGATDQYDAFKMQTPPQPTPHGVSMAITHSDWGTKSGAYSVDVRSPASQEWDFTVASDLPNTPVTLTWPNLSKTGKHSMLLTDLDSNVTFDLHNRASYVIPGSSAPITRRFRLQVGRATRPQLELLDVVAEMAPTRATGAPASATISFRTTAQATVDVTVLQNGRRIRSLDSGDTRAAGSSSVTWDLRNDQGTAMPSNVYMVEVRAVDAQGHMVHVQRPIVITR